MEKFNNIKDTVQFPYLVSIFNQLELLNKKKDVGESYLSQLHNNIREFAGYEMIQAYEFYLAFEKIKDYAEKFYDCKEKGLSYQLGCRYSKIDFTYADNINGEISFLKALLEVYNEDFKDEISLIKSLILDLHEFHEAFQKYEVS